MVPVSLHWLWAFVAFHADWCGSVAKGSPALLIQDGNVQRDGTRRGTASIDDLAETLRLQGRPPDPARVRLAYLEPSGDISLVPYPREPRVLDVSVEQGVQTVRITLHH